MREINKNEVVQQTEEKSSPFNLEHLIKLGVLEKVFELSKDIKVTIRTLSQSEKEQVFSNLNEVEGGQNNLVKMEIIKKEFLTRAISKINDQDYSALPKKTELKEALCTLQSAVVDKLFEFYQSLSDEQATLLASGLKKN